MNEQEALEYFLKYVIIGLVYFLFAFKNTKHSTKVFFSTGMYGAILLLANIVITSLTWPTFLIGDVVRIIKSRLKN